MVMGYLKEIILQTNKFEHFYKTKYYLCTRINKGRFPYCPNFLPADFRSRILLYYFSVREAKRPEIVQKGSYPIFCGPPAPYYDNRYGPVFFVRLPIRN